MPGDITVSDVTITAGNRMHGILAFVIGVLLILLPLKFQSFAAPFEAHSALISMFVLAVLVYAVSRAIIANLQSGNHPFHRVMVNNIRILSGSLAAVLLVFLIVVPALGWLVLLVWILFLFNYIYDAFQELRRLYQETLSDVTITAGNHMHGILAFVIGVLLILLKLKFQSFAAPFETHSALLSMFVMAVLVYAVSNLQSGNHPYQGVVVNKISMLSGSLAAVLLVFLIVVPALGWFVLLVWILFLFNYIYDACQELRQLYQEMSSASEVFHQVFGLQARRNEPIDLIPV